MKCNIGKQDQIFRLIVGLILVALPFIFSLSTSWFWISIVIGIVLIATSFIRFCPAYSIFGIRTCKKDSE